MCLKTWHKSIKQEKEEKQQEINTTLDETSTIQDEPITKYDETTDIENKINTYQHRISFYYTDDLAIQTTIKKEFSENNHNYVVEVTNDTVKIVVDNISI